VDQATKTGSITGRVVNESGQPLPNARISVQPVGGYRQGGQTATNREGAFKVTALEPVLYTIRVDMPGYITPSGEPESGPSAKRYKVGDSVTFVLTKGGVITGAVTNVTGDPVIGIRVVAQQMIRNPGNQRLSVGMVRRENTTDDRGVYRIYGLPTGTYLLVAGGDVNFNPGGVGAFDNFLPTFAPSSSTRDGALEINVRAGEETSNVDINFRAEIGRTVSGTVGGTDIGENFTVNLTTVVPAASQLNFAFQKQEGSSQFTFYGVADGDYYLTAASARSGEHSLSEPKLIKVRGADVEDVDLTLVSLGSVRGRVLLEESKAIECQGKQPPPFKEMSIAAWHKESEATGNQPQFLWTIGRPVNPDPQGNFTIRNLAPSQYYFAARFPMQSWYLKSIAMSPSPGTAAGRPRKPSDVTRVWTNVQTGDRLSGLTFTLAQGSALFEGQVAPSEGATRPQRLIVYLVPIDREAAEEPLRFYGAMVSEEGKIGPYNLAPGRYWVLAQPASDSATAPLARMRQPDATETRARLRRDAEAAKMEIEVKPCQNLTDFRLPL
jgi:hypothetical protein